MIYEEEYHNIDSNLTNCNVGNRRGRNIRDNIFIINAIMNQSKNNPKEAADIGVYDVYKCFDSLWLKECINDLFEAGLTNDKLVLLYQSNLSARVAIKTTSGITERFSISKTVMQGTVWSGLMCTASMDKLCKSIYNNEELLFKYRGIVNIPPLEMVDDILTAVKCGEKSSDLNLAVNNFVEHKKLKLSAKKCGNIHVGNKASKSKCPVKVVNGETMKESDKEKYLGDYLTSNANSKESLSARKARDYAILGEMSAILRDVPLGNRRTNIGLELRRAWFQNICLFNSEVWTGISENDLKDLGVIDNKILRVITGAHSKVPVEMLYIETSQLPISHVISVRRLIYWHTIIRRHKEEITSQVYNAMKDKPEKGDWIFLLKDDLNKIGLSLEDEESIVKLTKYEFKKVVKNKIRELCKNEMECLKLSHEKVKFIQHINLDKPQEYLTSGAFSNSQKSILFNLRSRCEGSFKDNFHKMYSDYTCQLCKLEVDTQEHALTCSIIRQHLSQQERDLLKTVSYEDIFGTLSTQLIITKLFQSILKIKKRLCAKDLPAAYPGTNTGPLG